MSVYLRKETGKWMCAYKDEFGKRHDKSFGVGDEAKVLAIEFEAKMKEMRKNNYSLSKSDYVGVVSYHRQCVNDISATAESAFTVTDLATMSSTAESLASATGTGSDSPTPAGDEPAKGEPGPSAAVVPAVSPSARLVLVSG